MAFVRQLSLFFSPRKLCFLLLLLLLIFAITLVLRSVRRRSAATIIDNFDDAAIDMRRFIKKNVFDEADDKMEMNEGDKPEGNGDYLHGDNKRQWSNELKPIDDDDSREKNNGRAVLESDVGKIGREKLKFSFEVDERKPKDDELMQESGGKHQWSEDSNSEENFKELSKDENPLKDSEPEEKSSQDRHESDDREPQQDDKIIMYNKAYVRHPQRPLFISNDDGAADPGSVDTKNSADGEAVRPAEIADVDDKLKVKHFGNLIASKKRYDKVLKSEELYRRNLDDVEVVRRENEDPLPKHSYFGTRGTFNAHAACEGFDGRRCVPKLQHSHTIYRVLPSRRLITCAIQKNMSTLLRAIMFYLTDPSKFIAAGQILTQEVFEARFYLDGNQFYNYEMNKFIPKHFHMTPMDLLDEWRVFAVIRDPIERFFSAYADKCIRKPTGKPKEYCNGCRHNLTCFVIAEYRRQIDAHGWNPLTVESSKFFPQSWECNFNEYLSHFDFLHYRSADNDWNVGELSRMLSERGVEREQLEYVSRSLKSGNTPHTTSGSPARQYLEKRLRSSPFLMEFIVRMYYWDYVLFNRTLPVVQFLEN